MKVFDEFLNEEVYVQEEITPEIGVELKMEDPEELRAVEEVEQ